MEGAMRRFCLHTRQGIYYLELIELATGHRIPAKSTETLNEDDALFVVADWLKSGIPTDGRGRRREARATFTLGSQR